MNEIDTAAERKATPIYSGCFSYFPDALAGVAKVSLLGSLQHHGSTALYDDRSKSNDDADCLLRHLKDAAVGDGMDGEVPHIDKVAWRALRLSQKWHEARGAPIAPSARQEEHGRPAGANAQPEIKQEPVHGTASHIPRGCDLSTYVDEDTRPTLCTTGYSFSTGRD